MENVIGTLSKSTVETALHISEVLLLVAGLALFVGIWGEYRKDYHEKWLAVFQVMVLAGIGAELLADAGVFLFSERLQRLEGADIQALDKKAREAGDRAADAIGKSKAAIDRAEVADGASKRAVEKSANAESSATSALDLAKGARQEADSFEKDIVSAKAQAAAAESHLAEALSRASDASAEVERLKSPRSISNQLQLVDILKPFKGTEFMFAGYFRMRSRLSCLSR